MDSLGKKLTILEYVIPRAKALNEKDSRLSKAFSDVVLNPNNHVTGFVFNPEELCFTLSWNALVGTRVNKTWIDDEDNICSQESSIQMFEDNHLRVIGFTESKNGEVIHTEFSHERVKEVMPMA